MGTVVIKNLSTLTDTAAVLRVVALIAELETAKEISHFEVNIKKRKGTSKTGTNLTEYTVTDMEDEQ